MSQYRSSSQRFRKSRSIFAFLRRSLRLLGNRPNLQLSRSVGPSVHICARIRKIASLADFCEA
ncbi:hypothetical protein HYDPIDRAFT_108815, partial [Hydnomerulius pinastri MD-312]